MRDLIGVLEAAQLTGISRPAIRAYTLRPEYRRYFSTYAAADEPGRERRFTEQDLRLLAFIRHRTAVGETHAQVADRLAAGEQEEFTWVPHDVPHGAADAESEQTTALVPVQDLRLAQALAADAQRREQEARTEAHTLREQVQRLTLELGEAKGALSVYERRKRPKWLAALFGE